jgi:hypothetical protein
VVEVDLMAPRGQVGGLVLVDKVDVLAAEVAGLEYRADVIIKHPDPVL